MYINGAAVIIALVLVAAVVVACVLRHAWTRLRLDKETVCDTEWPGQGG